jgi:MoaA/NifB/PqqE/SkfB family radical SAM enzyme
VDATLTARLRGGDLAEGVYAALDAVREARGLPLPSHAPPDYLLIALTNRCNFDCFFCCAENARADLSQRELPFERLEFLRPAIETAGVVDLSSPGEAFLYSRIQDTMAFVAEHNRRRGFQITTNGALLTEDRIGPVASRIDQITVSLNAGTPATHRRDLGSKHWDRVIENIRAARRLVAREKITLSCVTHAGNVHELPDLVRLAAELDVWHVRIVPIRVTKPELIRSSLWFCKQKAQDFIGEAHRIGRERGVTVNHLYEAVRSMSSSLGRACLLPTWGAYVSMAGNVTPCCHTGQVMGNVYEAGSFEAVWNGPKYRRLRKHLYLPECRDCPNIRGRDMGRLENHLDCQFGDHAPLPRFSIAVGTPASARQLRSAIASLQRQTYPAWEAVIELEKGADPEVVRAAREEAQADPRIRCGAPGGAGAVGAPDAIAICRMDPAKPFRPDELEQRLKRLENAVELAA